MLRNLLLAGLVTMGALVVWPGQPGGRLVRVYGDLAAADRVAIIVPGADTTVATFDDGTKRPGGAARALLAEAARLAPRERLAVVAWLGYDSPPTLSLSVITSDAAVKGAQALRHTITDLHARTPAPIALLCHSYGSVLCAKAVPGLPVTDLAVFGSPGLDAPSATALTQTPRDAETARATAPTANTTRGMTGGHDAQGATGPQDTRGRTNAQDEPDTGGSVAEQKVAGSGSVQKVAGSGSAQDAPGAQDSRRATGPQATADSPDAQRTAALQDTQHTADLQDAWFTADLPDARTTADVQGVQGSATGAAAVPLRVWAGLGENDWVRFVPKAKLGPVGFGADPMSPSFGARVFAVGSGGHSDYFTPGTPSLRNLALIALGRASEVTS
ncbi:alpha/beta hydrolase [Nonomuraea sp. JJY05]|uniref:alpha/beta hydrolase n=1 Tax=Nonomuraea sp. JJY05 TaxID=3350255 RepID=UPI00373E2B79